jgi:hypothetical protein
MLTAEGGFEDKLLADVADEVAVLVSEIVAAVLVVAELVAKTAPSAGLSHDAGYSGLHCCQFRLGVQ